MIKNIMKNIGTRPAKMGSKEYNEQYGLSKEDVSAGAQVDKIYERQLKRIKELRAKGLTDEQIDNDNIIKQTKEDMKNIGPKPAEVEEKEEVREDILPSKISTDDFSYKQLEDYASGLEEALETQKDKFTDETRASTEKELEAVRKALLKRKAEKKPAKHYPTVGEYATDGPIEQREAMQKLLERASAK